MTAATLTKLERKADAMQAGRCLHCKLFPNGWSVDNHELRPAEFSDEQLDANFGTALNETQQNEFFTILDKAEATHPPACPKCGVIRQANRLSGLTDDELDRLELLLEIVQVYTRENQ